ncbi:MAG: hypothetical protein HOM21_16890, partial [Halobacteriovoraceae bacterium]|nr:hypothetical protein [Halobacteriovoraceae bacterium]
MSQCPCGSQKTFSDCCEAIIKGEVKAETAEKVMRARYSAFSTGEVDFIVSSQHPESREEVNREEIQTWSSNSEWQGLEILGTHEGGEADKNGKVEFVAKYVMEGKL